MTHIPGHIPNGTLLIKDTLSVQPRLYWVHGYLYPAKNKVPDVEVKILFQNNLGTILPQPINKSSLTPEDWGTRKIGFHLWWIDLPPVGGGKQPKKIGIAYDIIDWDSVEETEKCIESTMGNKWKKSNLPNY